ncbi:MAG: hypothetical protein WD623_12075 [Marinobacter sp.]|uniref:hypothetical protein n=1 Tax=Marinobacter sp. TaxID=50741 RepID=UPI0034A06166
MSRKKTHAYTEEFRREAVLRSDQPGNTATSVAVFGLGITFFSGEVSRLVSRSSIQLSLSHRETLELLQRKHIRPLNPPAAIAPD